MNSNNIVREKSLIRYYLLILLCLITWINPNALPPMPIRLVYLFLVVYPVLTRAKFLFPIIFCTLVTISMARYAPSYMVSTPIYVVVALLIINIVSPPSRAEYKTPVHLLVMSIYMMLVNFFSGFEFKEACLTFLSAFLLYRYINFSQKSVKAFMSSFIIIAFVLSVEYLLVGKNFTEAYSTSEIERMGWMDPNVFGCIIGMGIIVIAIVYLYQLFTFKFFNVIMVGSLIVCVIAFLLNASRGASLALFLAVGTLIFISPVKKVIKISAFISTATLVVIMYWLGYFDNLIFRMSIENAETGGERTIIWATKIAAFLGNNTPLISRIFGLGDNEACFLGYGYYLGFHSDYVAMFVKYGFIGAALLIYLLIYPLKIATNNKIIIMVITLYLSLCVFSLDLINSGHIFFFYLYLFLLLLGKSSNLKNINNNV